MTPDQQQPVPNGAIPLPPQPPQPTPQRPAPPPFPEQPAPQPQPQMPSAPQVQAAPQPAASPLQEPLPRLRTAGTPIPPQQMNKEQSIKELKKAVGSSHQILMSATTVFPFTLVPDTITLDREKLTISNRFFFRIAEVVSIRIEDILNIIADVGPFFGSLKITTRFFDDKSEPHTVNYLWRSDALRFKRVVQGYIISRQKGIDSTSFEPKELVEMLDKLGQAAPGEEA